MKRTILLFVISILFLQTYAYTWEWETYGPDGIKANNLYFVSTSPTYTIIGVDTGMYFKSGGSNDFEFYSYTNMEVVDVVLPGLESDSLLMILRDGSWSDGIYYFNCETKQFSVVHYCYNPQFIEFDFLPGLYFVGYEYGLLQSTDGVTWTDVPFFSNTACIDMVMSYDSKIIATAVENENNTYLSVDDGATWTELEGENITELSGTLLSEDKFYGISQGESNNCGLYELDIDDLEWDNIFYSYNLSAVGANDGNSAYVGWHAGISPDEGVAEFNNELTYLNDGLPNLNINSLNVPFMLGATVVYCCTDGGVFSRVISVGIPENNTIANTSISPNPVSSQATIKINFAELSNEKITISILNNQGKMVNDLHVDGNNSNEITLNWTKGDLPAGVYYLVIKTEKEKISKKFIIL